MGVPRLFLGDPQMSASVYFSLVLARFFRKSPASGVCPSGRYSGEGAGAVPTQPAVFHSIPCLWMNCLASPPPSLCILESLVSFSRGATTRCRGWRRGLGSVHLLCTPSVNPPVFSLPFRESHCLHFWTIVGLSGIKWLVLYCFLPACRQLHIRFLYSGSGWVHGLV